MVKKLIKRKNGLSIEIDKAVADALGINQNTAIEMIIKDDMLIIKPINKKSKAAQKRKIRLKKQVNNLMDEYEPVLKKLAKT